MLNAVIAIVTVITRRQPPPRCLCSEMKQSTDLPLDVDIMIHVCSHNLLTVSLVPKVIRERPLSAGHHARHRDCAEWKRSLSSGTLYFRRDRGHEKQEDQK